jgi:hypothetical protein
VKPQKDDLDKNGGIPGTAPRRLSNMEIITLAVYVLGGESHFVDTEDAAVKANELAPGRFSWAKYPDQINIHTIKTHLWDAKSDRKGSLLLGTEKDGWMLTASGLELARRRIDALKCVKPTRLKLTAGQEQWRRGERVRMLNNVAYRKLAAGGVDAVTPEEAEAFFRLNAYVVGEARERKITRILNTFSEDEDLGAAVKELADKVRSR